MSERLGGDRGEYSQEAVRESSAGGMSLWIAVDHTVLKNATVIPSINANAMMIGTATCAATATSSAGVPIMNTMTLP